MLGTSPSLRATNQVGFDEANRSLGIEGVGALSRGLLGGLDLREVLLHAREFSENWVLLCVYAPQAKRVLVALVRADYRRCR